MKMYQKLMLGCALIAPTLVAAGSAQAQVSGVAIADPETVILTAKALDAANTSIATTYKARALSEPAPCSNASCAAVMPWAGRRSSPG